MNETEKKEDAARATQSSASSKFEVVKDAARWRCANCKSAQLEIAQPRGEAAKGLYVLLICVPCKVVEGYTKEEWDRALEI
jgi:RNase P subunit RPR2